LRTAQDQARELEAVIAGHQHAQNMRDKELGFVGRIIGGEKNAPTTVAAIAFILSMLAFIAAQLVAAYGVVQEPRVVAFLGAADKCLAIATLALGYICGKTK
jgi:hypothetical protein